MIFSELYSAYYNAVARILKEACRHPVSRGELRKVVAQEAFGESLLTIEPAILGEQWQLLKPDGTTPIRYEPTMPLTQLQKRWLKAIFLDPRVSLFPEAEFTGLDVEPLFRPEDIDVYDRYADGDPYADEDYIRHFRLILDAIKEQIPLSIEFVSPKGNVIRTVLIPKYLEYSEKDDKFRLAGCNDLHQFVNLSRITQCERYNGEIRYSEHLPEAPKKRTVVLELVDDRNALERALMHFAHFEKQAERMDDQRYRISITYNHEDETEILIRILAFGPVIRVMSPEDFAEKIKDRLMRQKKLGIGSFATFLP